MQIVKVSFIVHNNFLLFRISLRLGICFDIYSYLKGVYFSGFVVSLLSVVILRVTIEVYSIIYKAAIEFRDYMKARK